MIVTARNNGKHHITGSGYGLKVSTIDRERYFRREWNEVTIYLGDDTEPITVNIDNKSYWNDACHEFISKRIGLWLIHAGMAPWLPGKPPKLRMEHIEDNTFSVTAVE